MLSEENKKRLAAIQIKAADLRDKAAKQFPYEGTVPRVKGLDYKTPVRRLIEWVLYIAGHGALVLIAFFLLFGPALIILFVESYFWQVVSVAAILVGSALLYRLHRRQPILHEQFEEIARLLDQGDHREAVPRLRALAEQGYPRAQLLLGRLHAGGGGVARSDREAVRWYKAAAERGLAEAQYALGTMYVDGRGVPQSVEEGVGWYEKAAAQGFTQAKDSLAHLREIVR